VPYNLAWSERGLGPTNLQVQVMNAIFPNMANLGLCDLRKIKTFDQPLWKFGFWDLMYRVLSNEGYQFMRDSGGYDANVANANAVTQLPATEYSDTTKFLTLRYGYDQLPITVAKEFNDRFDGVIPKGQRIFLNYQLAEIECGTGEYPYTLHFLPTKTHHRRTYLDTDSAPRTVHAKKVILAMPRRSLELIKSKFFDDPWLKTNIKSVLIQHAFKLFLAYERPWWRALGLVAGRSVTDLPVRQIYYFGTECEQKGGQPFLNSLLMASYNDISTVPFWKGLEEGEAFKGYLPWCIEPGVTADVVVPKMECVATKQMVDIASRQVAEIHAMPEIPPPYSAIYHDWSGDPYGGGWHEWKAGFRLDEIMCRMRKPVANQDIHVVGEAYSYGQGWVEGALDTAESVLQDFFGLPKQVWLKDPAYQLLPNSCPGCGNIEGCIQCKDCGKSLADMTPDCCKPIQVG
jgi:lysine 2-monooxygenase